MTFNARSLAGLILGDRGTAQGKISIAVSLCGIGNKLQARSLNFGRHPGRGFDGETRLTGKGDDVGQG